MRTWTIAVAVVAACGVLGCRSASGGDTGALYRVEAAPVTVQTGTPGTASLRFVPREGYHWNEEFPAKVRLSESASVSLPKAEYATEDFKAESGTGVLAMAVQGKATGDAALKGTADFSMCNANECRIFKGIQVEVPIHVQ